ncbi:hypothetical protein AGRA3207_000168 [Actinomadura graeca]|uniref:Uncharacterized protein n=1 Tax=Actinomadura graeca TaxID=2750812 RepID=A0ABX8QM30_9ACTN|nr:hypothetical protein [Actinomadura graeca]QXJ19606.1 hypothetical protein AGRA3207_000168 [Actinomadura graeca]
MPELNAPHLTAEPDPDYGRIVLTASAFQAEAATVTVWRLAADGALRPVRSMWRLPLSSLYAYQAWLDQYSTYAELGSAYPTYQKAIEAMVWRTAFGDDYEAPQEVPVQYLARVFDAAGSPSKMSPPLKVNLPYRWTWLRDVGHPSLSIRAHVQSLPELARKADTGVHYVLGRRTPIAIADVRRAAEFELTTATFTRAEAAAARTLTDGTATFLLQGHPDEGGNLYFLAASVSELRISRLATEPARTWTFSGVETEPPLTPLITETSGRSYQDWLNGHATYERVVAAYRTYLDALRAPKTPPPDGGEGH